MGKWQDLRTVLESDLRHWQGNTLLLQARDDIDKVPVKMGIAFSVSLEEALGYVLDLMKEFDVQETDDIGGTTKES